MSRYSLRFTRAARAQLRSIGQYTEETWGAEQRDLYLSQLFAGFEAIRKSPQAGRIRDDLYEELRSKRVQKHVAYYLVKKSQVVIVGVLHERMDPTRHL